MNVTSNFEGDWFKDIQFGNKGAALFIITYIGFYGLGIMCLFGQQLKETQRERHELPASFLKTLWDVPTKIKLYQELADVESLKRIFRGYFIDHETFTSIGNDDLQAIVDERAHACALRYRQKLRHLHLSNTDYYLDTVPRFIYEDKQSIISTRTSIKSTMLDYIDREGNQDQILSITVV